MSIINTTEALARIDNDNEIYLDLIETFLELGVLDFTLLRTSLAQGKDKEVAHQIHQVKGASLTLGADNLAHAASLLEKSLRSGAGGDHNTMLDDLQSCYRESVTELASIRDALRKPS